MEQVLNKSSEYFGTICKTLLSSHHVFATINVFDIILDIVTGLSS
jgi:hypothetical protein